MSIDRPTYLLDTGWIVRHLRGHRAYTESIARRAPEGLAVSIISIAELQEGVTLAKDSERAAQSLATFLSPGRAGIGGRARRSMEHVWAVSLPSEQ